MLIYSLITARSGSKGIPDKNIIEYNGIPMIAHSIIVSKNSKYINRTFVSTDSEKYAEISKKYGAEIPFIRPSKYAEDLSTDYEVFNHFINFIVKNENLIPDLIIHLRPTYPNRSVKLLDNCIKIFKENYTEYDSLRSVTLLDKNPQKMYKIKDNKLIPYFKKYNNFNEPYNLPRQLLDKSYLHNGCIDIIKTSILIMNKSMSGENIYPYIMNENNDIDSYEDLEKSKLDLKK